MSLPPGPDQPPALDFSRAEYDGAKAQGATCSFCKKSIPARYWQVASHLACDDCREGLARSIAHGGSRAAFLSALQKGALAAAAGSLGWALVTKLTGYQLGIVAIGIGILVGKAVRKGSGGFGSRRLQVLAVVLTYLSISLASLPELLSAMSEDAAPTLPGGRWAWCVFIGIALASPFLGGSQKFMGLFIVGIGLYEAWKFSRPTPLPILGPFQLTPSAAPAPIEPRANESV